MRGRLKRLLLAVNFLLILFQARTSPMAFIVLNTTGWSAGRLPADWMIKVNHGKPELAVCTDAESCLRLKSVKASFGLEHKVDVDPVQMPWLSDAVIRACNSAVPTPRPRLAAST